MERNLRNMNFETVSIFRSSAYYLRVFEILWELYNSLKREEYAF
ncbi:MAG: hypothetical protein ACK4F9_01610 [Brevinematia bacterium]